MFILEGISQLATCRADGGQADIHAIQDGALAWEGDTIRWVGPRRELPPEYAAADRLDAGGRLVIPGLVDCHTHLAFGGWRAEEFEQRILGRSYLDIAAGGGGIARTMRLTREASQASLVERSAGFLREMVSLGVTTVECKSGYGLDREHELALLQVYRTLGDTQPVRLVPTFLGAHVVPPEFQHDRAGYLALLIDDLLPHIARERLAAFCDVFVERSAFTVEEARRLLLAARAAGLGAKLHADQLSQGGGAELAAEVGAVSADHLECASDGGDRGHGASGCGGCQPATGVALFGAGAGPGAAVDRGRCCRSRWPPTSTPARPRATISPSR